MSKQNKASLTLNILIFVFTLFAMVTMMTGYEFMSGKKVLSSTSYAAFKYFTVDSNVFAGIVSLIYAIFLILLEKGKIKQIPQVLTLLNLASTAGVTLTMMVTIFFLAPQSRFGFLPLFLNSNLFMHLVTPLLCIINFILFEQGKISFAKTTLGTLPMILYALYYIPNILLHLEDGKPTLEYDWYGFMMGNAKAALIVVPLVLLITWAFALALWGLNKKAVKERI
ncbi:MAG: hypothetical protein K6G52_04040 [Treponemataceae bacterium]|nr:hypothetical protein [Treponemataceae bacterium]